MKKLLLLILLISCEKEDMRLFATSLASNQTPTETVKVIILTYQSNALGLADNANATSGELAEYDNVFIWSDITDSFEKLDIGTNNLAWENGTSPDGYHGLELGLALNKDTYFPNEDLYIIKYAIGGTKLVEQFPGGEVYRDLYPNYVVPAINSLINEGKTPQVVLIPAGGEADAAVSTEKDDYQVKFGLWLDLWRSNLGSGLNIIGLQINESNGVSGAITVNNVFDSYDTSDSYYTILDTKNEAFLDNWHYSYQSFKNISIKAYDVLSVSTWLPITNLLELPSDTTAPTTGTLNSVVSDGTVNHIFNYTIGGDETTIDANLKFRIYDSGVLYDTIMPTDSDVTISGGVFIITTVKLINLTSYSFTITEIDEAGNESVESNAIVVNVST